MGDGGERFVHESRWRAKPEPTDEKAVPRQSNRGGVKSFPGTRRPAERQIIYRLAAYPKSLSKGLTSQKINLLIVLKTFLIRFY